MSARFLLAILAMSSGIAAIAAPQPKMTPAPVRPRQLSSLSSLSTTSRFTTTWGWYSGGQNNDGTVWAPVTWVTEGSTVITSGRYIKRCAYATTSSYISTVSSYSIATLFGTTTSTCIVYTGCSEGWLIAASTSYYCVRSQSLCKTDLLYASFGAADAYTWMYCDTTSSNASTITSYYQTKPIARPVTVSATLTSVSGSSGTATSSSSSTETSGAPASGGRSNTGAIAGGVVGGVAVLAIAAVGILLLLRRSRKKKQSGGSTTQAQPFVPPAGYTSEKPPSQYPQQYPQQQYPQQYSPPPQQYNPHQSMVYSDPGSDIRPPNSPTPVYTENNFYRTELPANSAGHQTTPEYRP